MPNIFFTVLSLLRSLDCCLGPSSYGKINHNHNYSDEIKIVQRDCSLIWENVNFSNFKKMSLN